MELLLTKDQKALSDRLNEELRDAYPYVFPEYGVIEQYVKDNWDRREAISVHLLYDYIISQGLGEVEE